MGEGKAVVVIRRNLPHEKLQQPGSLARMQQPRQMNSLNLWPGFPLHNKHRILLPFLFF